jgi:predicted O-methyltransferase YrrM
MTIVVTVGAFVGLTALLLLIYHKLSKAIQISRHESVQTGSNAISQVEGLLAVYAEVSPTRALPKSRGWAASPDFLAVLIRLVHERKPLTVLECSSGFSTLVLAASLRNLGRGMVLSLEHDPIFADKTRQLLALHGLSEWATVVDAPLVSCELDDWKGIWYDTQLLQANLVVDMLVIDGPPQFTGHLARYPAFPVLRKYLHDKSVLVLDDADRAPEVESVKKWILSNHKLTRINDFQCEKGCVILAEL